MIENLRKMFLLLNRLKNGTNDSVPIHLLSCDNRRGLRMRTIRLAFFKCSALMQSIKPPVAARYEPYTLLGMRLVLTWHEVIPFLRYFHLVEKTFKLIIKVIERMIEGGKSLEFLL